MTSPTEEYRFTGFAFPTTTPVPDQLFDELLSILSGAELKVLLYIIRRTFGFKKESDDISLNQMLNGIVRKDGTVLDQGVGLSKPTLLGALRSLKEKNILLSERRSSENHGNEPSRYRLNIVSHIHAMPGANTHQKAQEIETPPPLVKKLDQGVVKKFDQGLVKKSTPQQTVVQQTDLQQQKERISNNNSGGALPPSAPSAPSGVVVALIDLGIARSVATRLAERYSAERISEKIAFSEYLQATSPDKISNPKGWLRRAIEEDYAAPDGYRSPAEREKEAQKRSQEAEERRQQAALQEESRRLFEQQEKAEREQQRARREAAVRQAEAAYGTTAEQRDIWQQVRADLNDTLFDSQRAFIQDAYILTVDADGKAIIGTFTTLAQEMLGRRLAKRITKDLHRVHESVSSISVVLLNDNGKVVAG